MYKLCTHFIFGQKFISEIFKFTYQRETNLCQLTICENFQPNVSNRLCLVTFFDFGCTLFTSHTVAARSRSKRYSQIFMLALLDARSAA